MTGQHSFVVCIDESGDQGFTFTGANQSPEWFVLSAVVAPVQNISAIHQSILELKPKVGCDIRRHLHFKKIKSVENRRLVVETIGNMKNLIRTNVVMVHKPCLTTPEAFRHKNRLYFYFVRYLLERVSWLCASSAEYRDKKCGDGTAKVIFSAMPELSRVRVSNYFETLQHSTTSVDWSVIRPDQFETLSPNRHSLLQVADVVAASFFCAEHPISRFKSDEWIKTLKPTLFRSQYGKYRGYGLKLFPTSLEKQIAQGARSPWARSHFPT